MKDDKRCKCSFRIKMVGDGCRYCNPQFYINVLEEQIKDLEQELDVAYQLVDKYAGL